MEESTARKLRFLTLQVVGAVAVIHLVAGVAELVRLTNAGLLGAYLFEGRVFLEPEALLFAVSGVAILAGVLAVGLGRLSHRRAYLLGIGMMAVYIVGWLAFHSVLDHGFVGGGATPGGDGHSHDGFFAIVVSHYVEPLVEVFTGADQPGQVTLAVISKTLEVVALALLAVLLFVDPRVEEPDNPIAGLAGDDSAGD